MDDESDLLELSESELAAHVQAAYLRGVEKGRAEGKAQLKALSECNGSTEAVLGFIRKANGWHEELHPRDHGKFSSTGGSDGDGVRHATDASATGGGVGSGGGRGGGEERAAGRNAEQTPEEKITSLAARIKEVPAGLARRVSEWVKGRYAKLAARYGDAGAKAVLAGMVALAPVPVPGSSLIPIALAEAVRGIRSLVAGLSKSMPDLTPEQVQALAQEYLHELTEEVGGAGSIDSDGGGGAAGVTVGVDGEDSGGQGDAPVDDPFSPQELLAAAVEYAEACLADGTDPEEGLHRLYALASEGDDGVVQKASWREDLHPRDDSGRFVAASAIRAALKDPAKADALRARVTKPAEKEKLEAALSGETHHSMLGTAAEVREKVQASRDEAKRLTDELGLSIRKGEPSAEAAAALIPHLSTLTGKELSRVRLMLGASFGGKTRVAERRAALVAFAKGQIDEAQLQARDYSKLPKNALFSQGRRAAIAAKQKDAEPEEDDEPDDATRARQQRGRIADALAAGDVGAMRAAFKTGHAGLDAKLDQAPDTHVIGNALSAYANAGGDLAALAERHGVPVGSNDRQTMMAISRAIANKPTPQTDAEDTGIAEAMRNAAGAAKEEQPTDPEPQPAPEPAAPRSTVEKLAAGASPRAKDYLESALHNSEGHGDELAQVAAMHARAVQAGHADAEDATRQAVEALGGSLHGPAKGEATPFDPLKYESKHALSTGERVRVTRQPVLDESGAVAHKGEVGPAAGREGEKPAESEVSASPAPVTRIVSRTAGRNIDSQAGQTIRHDDGRVYVVTGDTLSRADDQGSYTRTRTVRPASPEEERAHEVREMKEQLRFLRGEADDVRDEPRRAREADALEDRIRAAEGRPSLAEERAAKEAETAAAHAADHEEVLSHLSRGRGEVTTDEDGEPVWARDYGTISRYLWMHRKVSTSISDLSKATDEELADLVHGRGDTAAILRAVRARPNSAGRPYDPPSAAPTDSAKPAAPQPAPEPATPRAAAAEKPAAAPAGKKTGGATMEPKKVKSKKLPRYYPQGGFEVTVDGASFAFPGVKTAKEAEEMAVARWKEKQSTPAKPPLTLYPPAGQDSATKHPPEKIIGAFRAARPGVDVSEEYGLNELPTGKVIVRMADPASGVVHIKTVSAGTAEEAQAELTRMEGELRQRSQEAYSRMRAEREVNRE